MGFLEFDKKKVKSGRRVKSNDFTQLNQFQSNLNCFKSSQDTILHKNVFTSDLTWIADLEMWDL